MAYGDAKTKITNEQKLSVIEDALEIFYKFEKDENGFRMPTRSFDHSKGEWGVWVDEEKPPSATRLGAFLNIYPHLRESFRVYCGFDA